jgi:3-deoxy-D-manno-octulosonic-acid transferase
LENVHPDRFSPIRCAYAIILAHLSLSYEPNLRHIYSLIFILGLPFILIRLIWRGCRAPAYFSRWGERFSFTLLKKPTSVIWLHAVSVGEVNAARPLIAELQNSYPQHQLLITTMTPTGSHRVIELYGSDVLHCYLPYDLPFTVSRFFRHYQPVMGIIMETELWPNLLHSARRHQIPMVLANARLSARSAKRYQRIAKTTHEILQNFSLIAAQTNDDRARLIELGAESQHVHTTGNLKFEITLPASVIEEADALRRLWQNRPTLIAASTHEGEDELILNAARMIRAQIPSLLLIIVPRHPERFERVAALSQRAGYNTLRRSENRLCTQQTQVLVVDSMGELPLFYGVSDVAFVGGSLIPKGGQNVLEPALLARPVLIGPHYFNFQQITEQFVAEGAAQIVTDSQSLAEHTLVLLQDPEKRTQMGQVGKQIIQQSQGASTRVMNLIKRHIHV